MDLGLLHTFLAVYRAGSLTRAAPRLGLSQPAVTARIRALEAQLGQQLFERLPRGVRPTSVADELAARIGPHLDALASVAAPDPAPNPLDRTVHLAGPAELTCARALPAQADLVPRGLRLRITLGLADDLLAGLAAGRFDLVLATVRPRLRGVVATPLADEEFVLVGAPAWAERLRRGLADDPAAALREAPLVSYAEDLPIVRRYWRVVFGSRPGRQAAVVVPDLRGVLAAVVAGVGVSVLPRYLCAAELAAGSVVALLRPELPPINTLFLAARAGTEELPHLRAVRDALTTAATTW